MKRIKTAYPGVYFIVGKSKTNNKDEKIYYIRYRKKNREIEEKAGRQFQHDMTPARAATLRAQKIEGKSLPNSDKRKVDAARRFAEQNKWTISKLWAEYKINKPRLKGLTTDQNRFDNYVDPIFGKSAPEELTPKEVDTFRLNLLIKRSPATVKNVLELLRRIINFGVKKNLCHGTNFTIEMPRVENLKTEDLTVQQMKKLLNTIDKEIKSNGYIMAAKMMKLALCTGMRRGEMFRLKWTDINFERKFIRLRDPKGGKDQEVPLNPLAEKIFTSMIRASKFVFPGRGGRMRTDIKKPLQEIRKKAGLPSDFRPLHGCRHVYASMLASSGKVDLYTLQKLMTHKSPQVTQRYAHLRDSALQKASNLAGDIINRAVKKEEADEDY